MSLILVDPVYNPELAPNITSNTKRKMQQLQSF